MQFSSSDEIAGVKMRDLRRVVRSLNDGGVFYIEDLTSRLKLDPQQGGELLQDSALATAVMVRVSQPALTAAFRKWFLSRHERPAESDPQATFAPAA
jgi:hypothetical protein